MRKILIIEDDVTVRENTAELLELSSYEVISASNGKLGVEKAIANLPDIVVCDIMMPEMDGYGVLKELSDRTDTAHIPFIFLSAKTEHKDIRKGMDLGADDYLTKPFEEEDLLSAIESRLAKVAILKSYQTEEPQITSPNTSINNLHELRDYMGGQEVLEFKNGESIYEPGKKSHFFYFVKKGVVKAHGMDSHGKELITELYKEDDFFGNASVNQSLYEEYATAMEDTWLAVITKDELHRILANNGKMTLELVEILSNNLIGIKQQLMEMAYGSVRKKTANTILLFAEKIKKHPLKSIRISRADLAGVAGMAPESLIRTLSDFKKENLIEIEGRNIKIIDATGLKNIS